MKTIALKLFIIFKTDDLHMEKNFGYTLGFKHVFEKIDLFKLNKYFLTIF